MRKEVSLKDNNLVLVEVDIHTTEKTRRILQSMKECPHLVRMMDIEGEPDRILCLYAVPKDKVWWATGQAEDPSVIGAKSARAVVAAAAHPDVVSLAYYPDRGDVPCRSDCPECPQYRTRCKGCPASRYYIGE
ncbi:MAG: hypothetical protein ACM3WU_06650 [Bacillota bacterium]